jgi:hypothetical protein
MKFICRIALVVTFTFGVFGAFAGSIRAQDMPSDYQDVLKSLDRKGDFKAGVLKVNIPRNDLKMTIQGFSTPTPLVSEVGLRLPKQPTGPT